MHSMHVRKYNKLIDIIMNSVHHHLRDTGLRKREQVKLLVCREEI